jgi:mRNA-degrading endonuclease RelE of RelBE toxin-antitoxin system
MRVGGLRIVYAIDAADDLVSILVVGPRGDIYKDL